MIVGIHTQKEFTPRIEATIINGLNNFIYGTGWQWPYCFRLKVTFVLSYQEILSFWIQIVSDLTGSKFYVKSGDIGFKFEEWLR